LIGDDYFQHVVKVSIHPDNATDEVISAIGRLPRINSVDVSWRQLDRSNSPKISAEQLESLKKRIQEQCPEAMVWSPGLEAN
jgi:hypothetical protein